jgi:hypothetical protein
MKPINPYSDSFYNLAECRKETFDNGEKKKYSGYFTGDWVKIKLLVPEYFNKGTKLKPVFIRTSNTVEEKEYSEFFFIKQKKNFYLDKAPKHLSKRKQIQYCLANELYDYNLCGYGQAFIIFKLTTEHLTVLSGDDDIFDFFPNKNHDEWYNEIKTFIKTNYRKMFWNDLYEICKNYY